MRTTSCSVQTANSAQITLICSKVMLENALSTIVNVLQSQEAHLFVFFPIHSYALCTDANEQNKTFSFVCFCQYCVLFCRCHTFAMNIHRIILTRFGRMSEKTGTRSRALTSSMPFCTQTIRNIWNESSGFGMCNINWKLNGKCEMQLNVFPNNKLPFGQVSDRTQNTYLPINFHVVCAIFARCVN